MTMITYKRYRLLVTKENIKRISIAEIVITGLLLSLAITSKFFDNFIPHVHPIHVVMLVIGMLVLRVYMASFLLASYLILKFVLFGFREPTAFMIGMHLLAVSLLFLISIASSVKIKNVKLRYVVIFLTIIIVMGMYLTLWIIGDTDYSPKQVPFAKKMWLALIWPGD